MKRRNQLILLMCLCMALSLALLLCSCNKTGDNNDGKTSESSHNTETPNPDDGKKGDADAEGRVLFFGLRSQPDRKELPSVFDFYKLTTEKVRPDDLLSLVGNPCSQTLYPTDPMYFIFSYKTAEGYTVTLHTETIQTKGSGMLIVELEDQPLYIESVDISNEVDGSIIHYEFGQNLGKTILTEKAK